MKFSEENIFRIGPHSARSNTLISFVLPGEEQAYLSKEGNIRFTVNRLTRYRPISQETFRYDVTAREYQKRIKKLKCNSRYRVSKRGK